MADGIYGSGIDEVTLYFTSSVVRILDRRTESASSELPSYHHYYHHHHHHRRCDE